MDGVLPMPNPAPVSYTTTSSIPNHFSEMNGVLKVLVKRRQYKQENVNECL